MAREERIAVAMKLAAGILMLILLSIPVFTLHKKIVDFLAEFSVQAVKYLFNAP